MRPFLKWAGNKYAIMDRIRPVLPSTKRLIEPFAGSAAVFLNTDYPAYAISDANVDLINLYKYLQKDGQNFIDFCKGFFRDCTNDPEVYYEYRHEFNNTHDTRLKSALFLYFNRHGYNGLCRYNSKGGFNVPFGKYKKPYFPQKEMEYFHFKSQKAIIKPIGFEEAMAQARPGDVIYCDPPYVPLSKTASFTEYGGGSFGQVEQERLAELAQELSRKNITVVISNHDTPFTQEVYRSAKIIPFEVQRFISCVGDNRNTASEVLAVFG